MMYQNLLHKAFEASEQMAAMPDFKCRHEEIKVSREIILYLIEQIGKKNFGINKYAAYWKEYVRLKRIGANPLQAKTSQIYGGN
jgi:hypothetical protein